VNCVFIHQGRRKTRDVTRADTQSSYGVSLYKSLALNAVKEKPKCRGTLHSKFIQHSELDALRVCKTETLWSLQRVSPRLLNGRTKVVLMGTIRFSAFCTLLPNGHFVKKPQSYFSIAKLSLFPRLLYLLYSTCCSRRSQWPHGLRHELFSLARTLGSWVRIPLSRHVCLSVCVYSVFVLGSGLAMG
jgi:hypothetical protein